MTNDDKTAPVAMTVPHLMRAADCCWGGVDRVGQREAVWLSEEDWRHYQCIYASLPTRFCPFSC
ncbi:Uncharacterised protein [Grimontia hollisae]|nr:Uncharacterised protein [Grimontia hollisae]